MQFRHPELLYALFLLIIPILVHLFQLRKFKKEAFTNVAFLEKINIQTRKSNQLKKWLTLLSRMAALAMIILAFAQPFYTNTTSATKEKETVIYLDNSFSMQAKGKAGPLLNQSIQELLSQIPEDTRFTLFTNTDTYRDITVKSARNTLLQIPYVAPQLPPVAISLKAKKIFSKNPTTEKRLIIVSDVQEKGQPDFEPLTDVSTYIVQPEVATLKNISVDSLYISGSSVNSLKLTALLSSNERRETNVPVSIFDRDQLLAKGTASFEDQTTASVDFEVPAPANIVGRIAIEDPNLSFDNALYFSLNSGIPVNVLSINEADDRFLSKIFTAPEFTYTGVRLSNFDYSQINQYNLIILNELAQPSAALANALRNFSSNGGVVVVIPSVSEDALAAYNALLRTLGNLQFTAMQDGQRLVTTINYDHPIYNNVFDKAIRNFQYPSVQKSYRLSGGQHILNYEDAGVFLTTTASVYVFAAGLNSQNTNFKNAPLIVPTLYNIGKSSLQLPQLYLLTNRSNTFDVKVTLPQDQIVTMSQTSDEQPLIPLQQQFSNKVSITTEAFPKKAANYSIAYKDSLLQQISYNYDRTESSLRYKTLKPRENMTYTSSLSLLFDTLKDADEVAALWKWFVIFALLFLLVEMAILKFFK